MVKKKKPSGPDQSDAEKVAEQPQRVTRVVTLPIREIHVPGETRVLDAFRPAWQVGTALANWCQRQLVVNDEGLRNPEVERLAKYDPKCLPGERSLYQHVNACCEFRHLFDGAAGSMGAIIKAVEDGWRSHPRFGRLSVLWRGEARPCVFRYPYPWPVRSQELRIFRGEEVGNNHPGASLTLPGGRVVVRLGDHPELWRCLNNFDFLLANPDRLKQAKVTGRHSGGRLVGADLRLVGEFDIKKFPADRTALICTGSDALLSVQVEGQDRFTYVGEELRGVIAVHDQWRHSRAVDLKYEKRWPSQKRQRIVNGPRVKAKLDIARNRLRTARQQVAAMIVAYLQRQQVIQVIYRDTNTSFLPRFDWSGLRSCVGNKCAEFGISFTHDTTPEEDASAS